MEQQTQQPPKKKKFLSLIQPTAVPTIGNYFGAMKNWPKFQDEFHTIFGVADLHAITLRQDPQKLKKQTLETYALLIATGLSPDKNILFIQSHVSTHAQMAWLLNCYTQFGELSRMTQFKDKSAAHAENVNAGLFTYPALMAADILLYQADVVPVGADQKQHIEITRNIAERFNGIYGNVFTVPEPYIPKVGARIMSLQEPLKKMSKSDENLNGFISVLDDPDVIVRKMKRAVTDSESRVCYQEEKDGIPGKDGVNNLMTLYACATGKTNEQITAEFAGKGYGDFKMAVAEAIVEELRPLQQTYHSLLADRTYLEECYRKGAEQAAQISQRTLDKAMKKIGFLLK